MATKITSPINERILHSLQWQGRSNDCGPYTTTTVINALCGLDLKAEDLAQKMNRPVWRGPLFVIRRVPNWATFPWGMVDVLREYRLRAYWDIFVKTSTLLDMLESGYIVMPVLGSWKPVWAHVMTLVAYDPERGWGFANTQYNHQNISWIDNSTFQKQWRALGHLVVIVRQ